ncbi:RNA polymerase sigma factor [Nocardia sp. NBC_00508]|uniref:RNA polymerase sigma factor n=1 Tax=Nocardia sp. NBC_00508 TaxID=2975992 RepID=UPI002E81C71B|nr:RNA polymerase sigma factor [Nocardia sp. NBC_00508]WUD65013.1 RNA polymerase sigma factor [Nocardia sp. NBC_00508]
MVDTTWPDAAVVASARDGDIGSIAALVSGSHPHVRRFAYSLCATPEDAEDAAQEALIVLYRKIGTLRASGALVSWMFRIVRNECLRQLRLRGRQIESPPDCAVSSAEEQAIRAWETERVAAAIAALPEDQRRVLIMRDVQGYSGRMVTDLLGLSTAAMKSRLHRARAAVQRSLRDMSEPGEEGP